MLEREEFLKKIEDINPKYNLELIGKAYDFARDFHEGQLRKSGEPYIIHPLQVVLILAELGMDNETLISGMLHDVIEDTKCTRENVLNTFGEEVLLLVEGVTKLTNIKYESLEELQAENFRKMFLAMSKDIRVLIIKLADRLHNMRTLEYMSHEKKIEKCTETLEIYSPLAGRLGMSKIKFELEDLALKNLDPDKYKELVISVDKLMTEREERINKVIDQIKFSLKDLNLSDYEIYGRAKHYYSIYRKMKFQNKNIDELFDLLAVRIIVDDIKECYAVLGVVHTMWTPIPGRFKDYIAMPKPNMYQSLHTTLIGESGKPFEVQIRTHDMHRIAEYGIAAHWKYKEGKNDGSESNDDLKLAWLRQSLELEKDLEDPTEFLESMKVDLFATQVYVFTPQGKVIELPSGSTPLDFAFKIHTEVGYKCVGAKINGKMVTIDYHLQNGDIVEIVTSSNSSGPSVDWLRIAKTSSARNKIRSWLKKDINSDGVDRGKDEIDKIIKQKGFEPSQICKSEFISKMMKEMKFKTNDEGFLQISNNSTLANKAAKLLISYYEDKMKLEHQKTDEELLEEIKFKEAKRQKIIERKKDNPGIIVKGYDNLMIKIAKCCTPVPGDEIVGFITKGRGISVHRTDCSNMVSLSPENKARFIDVEWENTENKAYATDINIIAQDRKGLLSDISKICDDLDVRLSGVNAKTNDEGVASMTVTLEIKSTNEMDKIFNRFRSIDGIIDCYRAKS